MTPEQRRCIIAVNALLCQEFRLPVNTSTIVYHHWYDRDTGKRNDGAGNNKSCPGSNFFGGNKVKDCETNFLPLVSQALQALGASPPAKEPLGSAKVSSPDGSLTIRTGPSMGSDSAGALTNGLIVQIYEAKGIWRRIDPASSRWVSSKFLTSV